MNIIIPLLISFLALLSTVKTDLKFLEVTDNKSIVDLSEKMITLENNIIEVPEFEDNTKPRELFFKSVFDKIGKKIEDSVKHELNKPKRIVNCY